MSSFRHVFLAGCSLLMAGLHSFATAVAKEKPARKDIHGVPLPAGAMLRLGEKSKLDPPIGIVSRVAFSPDGKTIATTCPLDQIFLWDAASGEQVDRVNSYYFDMFAGTWNRESQKPPKERCDFYPDSSPDGKTIAVVTRGRLKEAKPEHKKYWTHIGLLDPGTGKLVRTFEVNIDWLELALPSRVNNQVEYVRVIRPVTHLVLSPDCKTLAGAHGSSILVWDLERGRAIHRVANMPQGAARLAFSADSRAVVSAHYDSSGTYTFRTWELASGSERVRTEQKGFAILSRLAFADHRLAALTTHDTVRLVDPMSGRELGQFKGHDREMSCLAFSRDKKRLATGSHDTTVLVWTVPAPQVKPAAKILLSKRDLESAWADLAGADAPAAYEAIGRLCLTDDQAVKLFQQHLRPKENIYKDKLKRLLADLDGDSFNLRESATRELLGLGEVAELSLRNALQGQPSLEFRRRAESILAKLADKHLAPSPISPGSLLQALRAVETLEMIGTAAAQRLLAYLAEGIPHDVLTREAAASVRRLQHVKSRT